MIAVIGKNSFIALHLQKKEECKDWIFLSHQDALREEGWLEGVECVINFAFSPKLSQESYTVKEDVDRQIAEKIKNYPHIHYIMMSSRMVHEDNLYGRAKLRIEQELEQILGASRLCVLRCANIFGSELGRPTFFGQALTALKNHQKITLNMSGETRKDFIPVDIFCDILIQIAQQKLAGVYNIGSGVSVSSGDIAHWLIEGYGQGSLEIRDDAVKGQFFMDISKIKERFNIEEVSLDVIKRRCIDLGQELRKECAQQHE